MADLKLHEVLITGVSRDKAEIYLTIDSVAYILSMDNPDMTQPVIVDLVKASASNILDAIEVADAKSKEDFSKIVGIDINDLDSTKL